MNENCIVDIENLRVHFPVNKELVKAVEGVSFSINQGETLAVVGESGSGKSVTAMSILRLNDMAGAEMPTGSIKLRLKNNEVVDMFETSEKDLVNKTVKQLQNKNFVEDFILDEGDLAVFAYGGHGYEILSDNTKIIESKNGPFIDVDTDKSKF